MALNFAMSDCPVHGAGCTVITFATLDAAMGSMIHLNDAGIRAVHRRFGERVLALDVPHAGLKDQPHA